jgi:hypothetical protein
MTVALLSQCTHQSDYLSLEQRRLWGKYLSDNNWEHCFFSAHIEQSKLDKAAECGDDQGETPHGDIESEQDNDDSQYEQGKSHSQSEQDEALEDSDDVETRLETPEKDESGYQLLNREQLTDFMLDFAKKHGCEPSPRYDNRYQFGTVGFPNVGYVRLSIC